MIEDTNPLNIFVAAMWRSGSMHISRTLMDLFGFRPAYSSGFHGEGEEEQNVNSVSAGILLPYGSQVMHQHCKATEKNLWLLDNFQVKKVVVVRNLADTIVSILDRIMRDGPLMPGLKLPHDFEKWSKYDQIWWLVYHATPWAFQFVESWIADSNHYFVLYRKYFEDEVRSIQHLCDWLGHPATETRTFVDRAKLCSRIKTNFNVGISGRGAEALSTRQKDHIEDVALSYGRETFAKFKALEVL